MIRIVYLSHLNIGNFVMKFIYTHFCLLTYFKVMGGLGGYSWKQTNRAVHSLNESSLIAR